MLNTRFDWQDMAGHQMRKQPTSASSQDPEFGIEKKLIIL